MVGGGRSLARTARHIRWQGGQDRTKWLRGPPDGEGRSPSDAWLFLPQSSADFGVRRCCRKDHPVTDGLPKQFTVRDELYMIELQDPEASRILLTTELTSDPSPPGFGLSMTITHRCNPTARPGCTDMLGMLERGGRVSRPRSLPPAVTAVRRLSIPASIRTAPCRRNSTMSGRWGPSAPPAQRDQVGVN